MMMSWILRLMKQVECIVCTVSDASVNMIYSVLHRDVLLCVMKSDAFCSAGLKTNKHSYLINCDFQTLQFED